MIENTETKKEQEEGIKGIVKNLLTMLGFEVSVEFFQNEKDPSLTVCSISSPSDSSILIGKNGQNLKAVEHIAKLMVYKQMPGQANFVLDINDYRKLRAEHVVRNAAEVANRVRESKKAEALAPMSSYERRLVHVELASYPDVETESIGEEPKRRVVIRPFTI